MLRNQITGRVRLTDAERETLAEIGHKLGEQALAEVATIVKPATILTAGVSRPSHDRPGVRSADCSHRPGESLLGL